MRALKFERGALRGSYSKCRSLMLLFTIVVSVQGNANDYIICPKQCICRIAFDIENGSVLNVLCVNGDMHYIPVKNIERSVYKLVISPPIDQPNYITIGPIFTNPPFQELREIHIVHSNLPSIGQNSFWGLQNLKLLNLTYNNLTSIHPDNFRGLINLKSLFLSHNSIEEMPSEAFRHCTALEKLDVSYNRLPGLMPRTFKMLANLQKLDLSGNSLDELDPEVFKDVQQLRELKCRDCNLPRLNAQIYHIAHLIEDLDLGFNKIKYVLVDDFQGLKMLTSLKLDGNQISVIVDNVFGQNGQLQVLNLAYNRLAILSPLSLTNLTKLKHLDISHNRIERFTLQTFSPVVNSLRSINFSGNHMPLEEVALVLQILPDLYGVGLANLSLPEVPPNFFMFNDHIVALDISWNRITEFPIKLLSKTKFLRQLDVSHNRLTKLEETDLQRLEAIPEISLAKNRWHCDQCSVGVMLVYMNTSVLNGSLRGLRCYAPMRLRGTRLANMNFNTLEVCQTSHEGQVSVIAGLVLVLVAALATVTTALCCTRRRAQRYYTNEEKRLRRNHEHPEELLPHTELGTLATIHTPSHDPDEHT